MGAETSCLCGLGAVGAWSIYTTDAEAKQAFTEFLNELGLDGVRYQCQRTGIKTIKALRAEKADEDKWDAFCEGADLKRKQIRELEAALTRLTNTDSETSEAQQAFTKFLNELGLDGVTDECKRKGIKTMEALMAEKTDNEKWDAFCDGAALKVRQMKALEAELTNGDAK